MKSIQEQIDERVECMDRLVELAEQRGDFETGEFCIFSIMRFWREVSYLMSL